MPLPVIPPHLPHCCSLGPRGSCHLLTPRCLLPRRKEQQELGLTVLLDLRQGGLLSPHSPALLAALQELQVPPLAPPLHDQACCLPPPCTAPLPAWALLPAP